MSTVNERTALGTLFRDNWDQVANPVAWPNRPFTPPENKIWVEFMVLQGDPFQVEIGGDRNQHRHPGILQIAVYAPLNQGDAAALTVAEAAAQIFRTNKRVSAGTDGDIRFRTPEVRAIGIDSKGSRDLDEGTYYEVLVSIPFLRDAVF